MVSFNRSRANLLSLLRLRFPPSKVYTETDLLSTTRTRELFGNGKIMFRFKFVTPLPFLLDSAVYGRILSAMAELSEIVASGHSKQKGIINVAFIDDSAMRSYNREYRKIDATTDVLSFHYFKDFSKCGKTDIVGEVLLSESKIREQSKEYSHSNEVETYKLLIHSILHILGYDHETEEGYSQMKLLEDAVATAIERDFGIQIK